MGNSISSASNPSIYKLPAELIDQILTYSAVPDFISFKLTCKRYSNLCYSGSNYLLRDDQLLWLLDLPSHFRVEKILIRSLSFCKIPYDILVIKCCQLNYPSLLSKIISPSLNLNESLKIAVYHGFDEILNVLLEHGGNVNLTDEISRSLLEHAIRLQLMPPVQILLEHNADVNVQDNRHASPLRTAASLGLGSIVKLLLDHGADIDSVDPEGYSALAWSVLYGREEVVEILLENGANKKITSRDGKSLGEIGRHYGHDEMVHRFGFK